MQTEALRRRNANVIFLVSLLFSLSAVPDKQCELVAQPQRRDGGRDTAAGGRLRYRCAGQEPQAVARDRSDLYGAADAGPAGRRRGRQRVAAVRGRGRDEDVPARGGGGRYGDRSAQVLSRGEGRHGPRDVPLLLRSGVPERLGDDAGGCADRGQCGTGHARLSADLQADLARQPAGCTVLVAHAPHHRQSGRWCERRVDRVQSFQSERRVSGKWGIVLRDGAALF